MEYLRNFAITVKGILLSPKLFFDEISWDMGWKDPNLFFLTCAAVHAAALSFTASTIISMFAVTSPALADELKHMGGLPVYFFIYFGVVLLASYIGSHVISFTTTIALHLLGGSGSFQRTYTALSCCWVVLLYDWIPVLGWFAGLYFFYLAFQGLAKAHNVSGWKGILALMLGPGCIAVLIGVIMLIGFLSTVFKIMDINDDSMPKDPGMRRIMEQYQDKHEDQYERYNQSEDPN